MLISSLFPGPLLLTALFVCMSHLLVLLLRLACTGSGVQWLTELFLDREHDITWPDELLIDPHSAVLLLDPIASVFAKAHDAAFVLAIYLGAVLFQLVCFTLRIAWGPDLHLDGRHIRALGSTGRALAKEGELAWGAGSPILKQSGIAIRTYLLQE
jgi:hypothetical protein